MTDTLETYYASGGPYVSPLLLHYVQQVVLVAAVGVSILFLVNFAWMWMLDPAFSIFNWFLIALGMPKPISSTSTMSTLGALAGALISKRGGAFASRASSTVLCG